MADKTFKTVMVTGHRPELLTVDQVQFAKKTILKTVERLKKVYKSEQILSGAARGVDTWWALAGIKLGLDLNLYIPFEDQAKSWEERDQSVWRMLRSKAESETVFSEVFGNKFFHVRNDAMLKDSDLVVAVWDPTITTGGTASVVEKARKQNKPMLIINLAESKVQTENFK